MRETFYSNGKLLLSGEYLVLDGALALAVPTRFGQSMIVKPQEKPGILWQSYEADGRLWFQANFAPYAIYSGLKQNGVAGRLLDILQAAHRANPDLLQRGYAIRTQVNFPREWGLGTSSTLINNIADWFGIDAFMLLWNSFGGSGYDIACARHDQAVLYRRGENHPQVTPVVFKPNFAQHLYFVFLNRKQDSKAAIAHYKTIAPTKKAEAVNAVNHLTAELCSASDLSAFSHALEAHEELLAALLNLTPVKQSLFPDFNGSVKSLGAWGGDFVLAVSEEDPTLYFRKKGYETILRYSEMVK